MICRFQDGLVEQGSTQPLPFLPVAPYLRELSRAATNPLPADVGLLPDCRRASLAVGDRFHLNWAHLQTFETNRRYLADWPILNALLNTAAGDMAAPEARSLLARAAAISR